MAAALIRVSRPVLQFFSSSEKPAVIFRNIHTRVWWDINGCKVPRGCDASSIAGNITAALAKLNYSAPITISAYGNMNRIPLKVRLALSNSGVSLFHVPGDPSEFKETGMNLCRRDITRGIYRWTKDHPPPANCLVIVGKGSWAPNVIDDLLREYNVLFASPRGLGESIKRKFNPKAIWRWRSLRAGGLPEWTPSS